MNQTGILHHLLIMLIIFFTRCNTDKGLYFFKSKMKETFQKTPKVWHNFIKKFLHNYLKENQCKIYKLNIFEILNHSLILLKLKDKCWASNGFSSGPNKKPGVLLSVHKQKIKSGPHWQLTKGNIHNFTITRPSGKINIIKLQSHWYKLVHYYYLYFNLNSQLRLNVTFISLVLTRFRSEL